MNAGIIPFYSYDQTQSKERTLNAIKYKLCISVLQRLLERRQITSDELEVGRKMFARKFNQTDYIFHGPSSCV